MLVFVLIFLAWTPTGAFAKPEAKKSGTANPAVVSFTVVNRSYGALQVFLTGEGGTYLFYVTQGRQTYQIVPGTYHYTVNFAANSLCQNWFSIKHFTYVDKTSDFSRRHNKLGPYQMCTLK